MGSTPPVVETWQKNIFKPCSSILTLFSHVSCSISGYRNELHLLNVTKQSWKKNSNCTEYKFILVGVFHRNSYGMNIFYCIFDENKNSDIKVWICTIGFTVKVHTDWWRTIERRLFKLIPMKAWTFCRKISLVIPTIRGICSLVGGTFIAKATWRNDFSSATYPIAISKYPPSSIWSLKKFWLVAVIYERNVSTAFSVST